MRININMKSLGIYSGYKKNIIANSAAMDKIASGKKINSAKDNPLKIEQSENFKMQIRALEMSNKNLQDSISMVQVADSSMDTISEALIRMKELTVQAGNEGNTEFDRKKIQEEVEQLKEYIDTTARDTEFNGNKLLQNNKITDNSKPLYVDMQIGANVGDNISIPFFNISSELLNIKDIDITTSAGVDKALDNISFEIKDRDFVGLIGHTGSGKSTLIQHLNGLLKPASGKIYVDRTDITDKDTKLVDIRKKVGLVFQYPEYQLFEETIAKDIAYGPTNLGLNEDEILRRVKKSMEMVGLDYDEYKDISPFELSGGQKRRVAIAGVIAMEPNVLILDEPTAGLDPISTRAIVDIIKGLNDRGVKIIISSHDMNLIYEICDYVYVLNQGVLINEGTRAEVFVNEEKINEAGLELPWLVKLHKNMGLPLFPKEEDLYSFWNKQAQKTV